MSVHLLEERWHWKGSPAFPDDPKGVAIDWRPASSRVPAQPSKQLRSISFSRRAGMPEEATQ